MPTLSTYYFDDTDFRGTASCFNLIHSKTSLATFNHADINGRGSALIVERPDEEIVIDLVPQINTPVILDIIDRNLGENAIRTSPVKIGWRPWRYVEYHDQDPARHKELSLLIRVFFDLKFNVPEWCVGVTGDVEYYIIVQLNENRVLQAFIDGWSFHTSKGSVCRNAVRERMNQRVPASVQLLQALIDAQLAPFANQQFLHVYLLPGDGNRNASGTANPDEQISIALIPLVLRFVQPHIHPIS
jgi:hypothetical protein